MRMLLGGAWVDRRNKIEVINPFDGSLVDTVPQSSLSDVEQALVTAERGARAMRELTGYQRYEILHKVADLLFHRMDDLVRTITLEEGKILGKWSSSWLLRMRIDQDATARVSLSDRPSTDCISESSMSRKRNRVAFS